MRIDLNSDVGEAGGHDHELIPLVTSVSIACGGHAGDAAEMARTVELAVAAGAAIGAHPGYPDREGFGRRELDMTADELESSLRDQLAALAAVVDAAGQRISHVKPHGALYNKAAADPGLAQTICRAIRSFDPSLVIFALAGSLMVAVARDCGLAVAAEAFADRAYEPDGTLRSRRLPGAMMPTPEAAAAQAVSIATRGELVAYDNSIVRVSADTLCIHGDTPGAVEYARAVRAALTDAGVTVAPLDVR